MPTTPTFVPPPRPPALPQPPASFGVVGVAVVALARYLFTLAVWLQQWQQQTLALFDRLQTFVGLVGAVDGANATFTSPVTVRWAAGHPQALLLVGTAILPYSDSATPPAGMWHLTMSPQQVILGTPPAPGTVVEWAWVMTT